MPIRTDAPGSQGVGCHGVSRVQARRPAAHMNTPLADCRSTIISSLLTHRISAWASETSPVRSSMRMGRRPSWAASDLLGAQPIKQSWSISNRELSSRTTLRRWRSWIVAGFAWRTVSGSSAWVGMSRCVSSSCCGVGVGWRMVSGSGAWVGMSRCVSSSSCGVGCRMVSGSCGRVGASRRVVSSCCGVGVGCRMVSGSGAGRGASRFVVSSS